MVEILPFMFNASYFSQDDAATKHSPMQPSSTHPFKAASSSSAIVFPPVSLAVPTEPKRALVLVAANIVKPIQRMFHCGNKTHDSLFVCFYVLKNNDAMRYHRDARRWPMLERQHKIEAAAALRDPENMQRLVQLFPKKGATKVGQIDDDLTNPKNPTISIKTFISLCCICCINIVLVDDDLRTMCVLQSDSTFNNSFPKHSVHIRGGNCCIMWDNDLDILKQRTEGYATVFPADVTFALQLCEKNVSYPRPKAAAIGNNNNELKTVGAYKVEELQTMCIARDICCAKIAGTGKGNKILKIDLYNSILQKMGV